MDEAPPAASDEVPPPREEIEARLDAMGARAEAGEEIDLAEGALLLAALDRPRVGLERYRRHLQTLVHDVAVAAAGARDVGECVAALSRVIAGTHDYSGDTLSYDDVQNANLMRVIDRRRGLPVALGIVYAHAARGQGWDASGLAFPGHFLIRLDAAGGRAIVDPFGGGGALDAGALRDLVKRMGGEEAELAPRFYDAVGDREVLLRLQNNIKLRALQAEDFDRAAAIVSTMLRLAPKSAALWHEKGVFEAQAGRLAEAIRSLEACLAVADDPMQRHQVAAALQKLRASLN